MGKPPKLPQGGSPSAGKGRVWEARTGSGPDPLFLSYSESTHDDVPYVRWDLAASVAHVLGLARAKLVTDKEAAELVDGLQALWKDFEMERMPLDRELEDAHMNIEKRLTDGLGHVAAKLHTGRSRNDQVATAIVLETRSQLTAIARDCRSLAQELTKQVEAHATTPWVARTHGQQAQPATLGFLLAAHAFRFLDLSQRAYEAFVRCGESPLGCGAVAGSTLPLDPVFTAELLGLAPPRNALLTTSSRDLLVETCQVTQSVGLACSALAQDLIDLVEARAATPPAGFVTGSSLMPQKINPDALELARAHGKALVGQLAALAGIVGGLPLGYHRDLQLTKPLVTKAANDATLTLTILAKVVEGTTFDEDALAAQMAAADIGATDVAEALVVTGVPFRDAYTAVAKAWTEHRAGKSLADALDTQGLTPEQVSDAVAVATPDPARRDTCGGPSPRRIAEQVALLHAMSDEVGAHIESAIAASRIPLDLMRADPQELVRQALKET